MSLPELLHIQPFKLPVRGEVTIPGSKSLTNRALLLAACCDTSVTLTGALFSDDTRLMANALNELGFTVRPNEVEKTLKVSGHANAFRRETVVELDVGLAGTAARFLTALCAAAPRGTYRISGVPQMHKRPMKGLIDALGALGAKIKCLEQDGFLPIEIEARGLSGGANEVVIDASESSQMLSALLMVAPGRKHWTAIRLSGATVSKPFVRMTCRMMEQFGQDQLSFNAEKNEFRLFPRAYSRVTKRPPPHSPEGFYDIEIDATAASYFAALPIVVGGSLRIKDLLLDNRALQGDFQFIRLLIEKGLLGPNSTGPQLLPPKPLTKGASAHGFAGDFNAFSDTFLTLAAIAPLLEGTTTITGIAHTRHQETDRVRGMANELRKLLGDDAVSEAHDSLVIRPNVEGLQRRASEGCIEIETYGDHRFAMSFAILGCHDLHGDGRPWLSIKNPACCAKTFPNFFDVLGEVWRNSHPI